MILVDEVKHPRDGILTLLRPSSSKKYNKEKYNKKKCIEQKYHTKKSQVKILPGSISTK